MDCNGISVVIVERINENVILWQMAIGGWGMIMAAIGSRLWFIMGLAEMIGVFQIPTLGNLAFGGLH